MQYLLDTHTSIWFFNDDIRLSAKVKDLILDESNELFVSIASVWEQAIKLSLNKLRFPGNTAGFLDFAGENYFKLLGIFPEHIFNLERLPPMHKDPFDRILIAQAISENMPILTRDRNIPLYPVETIW